MIFEKLKALFTKSEQRYAQRSEPNATKESSSQGKRVDVSRIGELGEYKIDVQLRQLPKEDRYLSDVLLPNPKSRTGYSQIDHIVITPCAVFVIETKNYQGLIAGISRNTFSSKNTSGMRTSPSIIASRTRYRDFII